MAFVVLDYHFNLRKIFRDLERNGIQNAICAPGVKPLIEVKRYDGTIPTILFSKTFESMYTIHFLLSTTTQTQSIYQI